MRQWICRHRRHPHTIPHTGSFQGSKDSSKWLYPRNDGREKMQFLCHPLCPPGLLLPPPSRVYVSPQRHWQRVAWSHGFTFPHVPTCISRMVVTHVACTPPTAPDRGQQKRPIATTGADTTVAPPSLHMRMLRSTQLWSKMKSGIQ